MDLGPSLPNNTKDFLKILTKTVSISWASFMNKWFPIQKLYSKIASTLSAYIHHDVTIE